VALVSVPKHYSARAAANRDVLAVKTFSSGVE
jgi:hypothetical protein